MYSSNPAQPAASIPLHDPTTPFQHNSAFYNNKPLTEGYSLECCLMKRRAGEFPCNLSFAFIHQVLKNLESKIQHNIVLYYVLE